MVVLKITGTGNLLEFLKKLGSLSIKRATIKWEIIVRIPEDSPDLKKIWHEYEHEPKIDVEVLG